jgi:hypothetical protein
MHVHLTKRQEDFCVAYVETGCATEAYRKAGYSLNLTPEQMWTEASQMLKNPKVAQRVWDLRMELTERQILSIQEHLANLQHLRNLAASDGKWQAAITAEVAMGRTSGLYASDMPVINVNQNVSLQPSLAKATEQELDVMEQAAIVMERLRLQQ